jgi:hypothetical protein
MDASQHWQSATPSDTMSCPSESAVTLTAANPSPENIGGPF